MNKRMKTLVVVSGLLATFAVVGLAGMSLLSAQKGDARASIVTVLHFNDSHSFWYPHDRRDWGGLARLATKIQSLKASIPNEVLVMVAGDVIEGRFFNRYYGGVGDLRIFDKIGVDYVVIGNHDWLIGPYNQYFVFSQARPNLTILGANIAFTHVDTAADKYRDLPPEFALRDYIKPYDVRVINGRRIGFLGISTYDYIYDPYYFPVTMVAPGTAVPQTVTTLKNQENCSFIIGLSHLGLSGDHDMYGLVCPGNGLSVIVGGHSHTKVFPEQGDGCTLGGIPVEIVQAWAHGKLLGRIDIDITNTSNPIQSYTLYQIDDTIAPDPGVASLIDDMTLDLIQMHGIPDDDAVLTMNVDLDNSKTENKLSNMICDAYRWSLNNSGHPVAMTLFNVQFMGDYLERTSFLAPPQDDYAAFSSLDLYNVIPHTYDPSRNVSWLLYVYELYGWELEFLVGTSLSYAFSNVSGNVRIVYDPSKKDADNRGVNSFKINGQAISEWSRYRIGVDEGLKAALDQLGAQPIEETRIEAWQSFRDYVRAQVGTISRGVNDDIDGRVRTAQPDVAVFESYISFSPTHPSVGDVVTITTKIKNWGNQTATAGSVTFYYDHTPQSYVDDPSLTAIGASQGFTNLATAPNSSITKSVLWNTAGLSPGLHPVYVYLSGVSGEQNTENNMAEAFIELQ